jgi:hypothetical protein
MKLAVLLLPPGIASDICRCDAGMDVQHGGVDFAVVASLSYRQVLADNSLLWYDGLMQVGVLSAQHCPLLSHCSPTNSLRMCVPYPNAAALKRAMLALTS